VRPIASRVSIGSTTSTRSPARSAWPPRTCHWACGRSTSPIPPATVSALAPASPSH